jgi:hypothetical protein
MGRTYSSHGRNEKWIHNCGRVNSREEVREVRDKAIDGNIILKWISEK